MANPNANAAAVTTALVALVEYLLAHYGHMHMGEYYATSLAGVVAYVVLLIGRGGIKGLFTRLWSGTKAAWSGKQA